VASSRTSGAGAGLCPVSVQFLLHGLPFRPLGYAAARRVLTWRYEPPYDFYNPPEVLRDLDVAFLADPANGYWGIFSPLDDLVAFCCYGADAQVPGGDYPACALDVGMGLRPDLTGQGLGLGFAQAVLAHAGGQLAPARFRVTVAAFNGRALRVWEKAGFQRTQVFPRPPDGMRFVVLVRAAGAPDAQPDPAPTG
jgi:[ribosomal protein S18]-alanine N-acetyltransferase